MLSVETHKLILKDNLRYLAERQRNAVFDPQRGLVCGKCLRPYYAPYYHYCFQPPFGTTKLRQTLEKP